MLGTLLTSCTQKAAPYRIASRWLPDRLAPWHERYNATSAIYPSIYFPLVQVSDDNQLTSEYLDIARSKAMTAEFNRYQLCLRPNLRFSDGSPITIDDLSTSLNEIHQNQWALPKLRSISTQNDCLLVSLQRTDPEYLHRFQFPWAVVLKKSSIHDKVPIGIGPYRITAYDRTGVKMEANPSLVPGDLKELEFIVVDMANPSSYLDKKIDDWNFFNHLDKPESLTRGFTKITRSVPRSTYLNVFYPDKNLRMAFSRCLDRDGFLKAAQIKAKRKDHLFPDGMLPENTPAAFRPASDCHFPGNRPQIVYHHLQGDVGPVKAFFHKAGDTLPFEVIVKETPLKVAMEKWSHSEPEIIVSVISGDGPRPDAYFSQLLSKTQPEAAQVEGLTELLTRATFESDPRRKSKLLLEAEAKILSDGTTIPIGQPVLTFLYRPDLENVVLNNTGMSFPQFHLIKVRPRWQAPLATMLSVIGL